MNVLLTMLPTGSAIQINGRCISVMTLFMHMIPPKKSRDKHLLKQIRNQEG